MEEARQLYARAIDALNAGQWRSARDIAGRLLGVAPGHAGVHFVAGVAALRERDFRPALDHLQTATRLNADRPDYAAQSAAALSAVFLGAEALTEARRAMALGGLDAMSLDTVGVVFTQNNAHAEALEAFAAAVAAMPSVASYRFNLATSLTFNGRLDEAEQEYEACIARDPRHWKAHLALSQHRRQTTVRNHIERLRMLRAEHDRDPVATLYLDLALAKELEDLGEYP
ncbi:MAG: tetratricopeptide repeat protein, partial [Lysobacter sp.]|nr:tetratricopeptide repeat protein [Lysobacter sp.]